MESVNPEHATINSKQLCTTIEIASSDFSKGVVSRSVAVVLSLVLFVWRFFLFYSIAIKLVTSRQFLALVLHL